MWDKCSPQTLSKNDNKLQVLHSVFTVIFSQSDQHAPCLVRDVTDQLDEGPVATSWTGSYHLLMWRSNPAPTVARLQRAWKRTECSYVTLLLVVWFELTDVSTWTNRSTLFVLDSPCGFITHPTCVDSQVYTGRLNVSCWRRYRNAC